MSQAVLKSGCVSLEQLNASSDIVRSLQIHSYQGGIYLAKIETVSGEDLLVVDKKNRPLRFRGKLKALGSFRGLNITKTYLVHESPYCEMIGLDQQPIPPMKIKIKNPDNDFLPV